MHAAKRTTSQSYKGFWQLDLHRLDGKWDCWIQVELVSMRRVV
jgi:hypothetical protein